MSAGGAGPIAHSLDLLCGALRAEGEGTPRRDAVLAFLEQPLTVIAAAAAEAAAAADRAALPELTAAQRLRLAATSHGEPAPISAALAGALRRVPRVAARAGIGAERLARLPAVRGEVSRIQTAAGALRVRAGDARLLLRAAQGRIHDRLLAWRERKLSQLPDGDVIRPLIDRELAEVLRLAEQLAARRPPKARPPAPAKAPPWEEFAEAQAAALLDDEGGPRPRPSEGPRRRPRAPLERP